MNRPIKFRAWTGTKMLKPFTIQDMQHAISTVGRGYRSFGLEYESTIMQFTGLCDASGKEIYEGDVVEAWWYDKIGEATHRHVYYMGRVAITPTKGVVVGQDTIPGTEKPLAEANGFTVIGNIYEHPHLLEEDPARS